MKVGSDGRELESGFIVLRRSYSDVPTGRL